MHAKKEIMHFWRGTHGEGRVSGAISTESSESRSHGKVLGGFLSVTLGFQNVGGASAGCRSLLTLLTIVAICLVWQSLSARVTANWIRIGSHWHLPVSYGTL